VDAAAGGSSGGNRYVEISVGDSGPGIPAEILPHLFDPLCPIRGAGLGLPVVGHLVRAHGGHVAIDSVPGQGTVVRVELPREKGSET
jgi:signal transduction histidine kinase